MAQHDYDIANGTGAAVRSDLNAALAAVLTLNSGVSSPSTTQAYMLWADTNAGQLKIRNAANNNWIVIGTLASTNLGLVPNTGGSQANVLGSAGSPSYSFSGDSNTGAFSPGADIYGVATNGSERCRFTANGFFKASNSGTSGYGSTTSNEHEVSSDLNTGAGWRVACTNASYTGNAITVIANRNTTNQSFNAFSYFNAGAGAVRFAVTDAGTLQSIGSYNATTANAANMWIDANGFIARSTSSGDYKTDIEPVADEAVNVALELNPIRYRSLADGDNSEWSYSGLIAEDVAAKDPRLVHWGYRDDDYEVVQIEEQRYDEESEEVVTVQTPHRQLKAGAQLRPEGVQYERVGVLTLAMVQRLHARVEALEARLAALDS